MKITLWVGDVEQDLPALHVNQGGKLILRPRRTGLVSIVSVVDRQECVHYPYTFRLPLFTVVNYGTLWATLCLYNAWIMLQ